MQVTLKLFEDDAGSGWGLAHSNAINRDEQFNSFWNGVGIFHDVFEHYFEDESKHFRGQYAFNIAGEVAAMGHLSYYRFNIGLGKERARFNDRYLDEQDIIRSTHGDICEAAIDGYLKFGNEFLCSLPKQPDTKDYTIEGMIDEHIYKLSELKRESVTKNKEEKAFALAFRKTITPEKLRRLYRWGYYQAEKIAPFQKRSDNCIVLTEFINYWDKFTKLYEASYLQLHFDLFRFEVGLQNDIVTWDCNIRDVNSHEWIKLEAMEDHMYQ